MPQKTYSQQKRMLILPALLTFALGLGLILLKVDAYAFTRTTEREAEAQAVRGFLQPKPYFATAYAKDPEAYDRQCDPDHMSAIVTTRTWMLIRGPAVEVCLSKASDGRPLAGPVYQARLKRP